MQQDSIRRSDIAADSVELQEADLQRRGSIEMQPASLGKSPNASNPTQLKVLVIEDEENIIELIKLGLRYEGFGRTGRIDYHAAYQS